MRHAARIPHFERPLSPLGAAQHHVKEVGRRNARVIGITIVATALVILVAVALWFAVAH